MSAYLHIKSEIESDVFIFDRWIGVSMPNVFFNIELNKGNQSIVLVNRQNCAYHFLTEYTINDTDCEYILEVKRDYFEKITQKASEKELADGIMDDNGVIYSADGTELLKCNNRLLSTYSVKEGCRIIRDSAFCVVDWLNEDNQYSYWYDSRRGCCQITEITLPDSLTHIGDRSFCGCEKLETVSFPENLFSIGNYAFESCRCLHVLYLPNRMYSIGEYCFSQCEDLMCIRMPQKISKMGNHAFDHCGCIKQIIIPEGITVIPVGCFSNCGGLLNVELPQSVSKIETGAFDCCHTLSSINLPNGITYIGAQAFALCSLEQLDLPSELKYIGEEAFMQCGISRIVIPQKTMYIGQGAFSDCEYLKEVILPSCLAYIGRYGFPDRIMSHLEVEYPNLMWQEWKKKWEKEKEKEDQERREEQKWLSQSIFAMSSELSV